MNGIISNADIDKKIDELAVLFSTQSIEEIKSWLEILDERIIEWDGVGRLWVVNSLAAEIHDLRVDREELQINLDKLEAEFGELEAKYEELKEEHGGNDDK